MLSKDEMKNKIREWLDSGPSGQEIKIIYDRLFPCDHKGKARIRCKSGLSASCAGCGGDLGWWCPSSKDNECHYYSEDRNGKSVVVFADGSESVLPSDHDPEYESSDSCIFCGHPDERK